VVFVDYFLEKIFLVFKQNIDNSIHVIHNVSQLHDKTCNERLGTIGHTELCSQVSNLKSAVVQVRRI